VHSIAVAALSARQLAQAGAQAGLEVVALDVFGDRDTRAAAARWLPVGTSGSLCIDAAALLEALRCLARGGAVQGWVAGSGFEAQPELLEQGAALLPLLGTAGADVRRVRDPKAFFGTLDALGIPHPEVRHGAAGLGAGWLIKNFGACGASHIRRADAGAAGSSGVSTLFRARTAAGVSAARELSEGEYAQREAAGAPMSATFIGNGRRARLLGCNQQIVRPHDAGPYRYHGVIGPLPVPAPVRHEIGRMLDALTEAFTLRGLGSLDFMLNGQDIRVLEVNPRPSASMELYPQVGDRPVLRAHLAACAAAGDGGLPVDPRRGNDAEPRVRGTEIVFAPHPVRLSGEAAARLASLRATHDLPRGPDAGTHATHFAPGEPLCSVGASGADATRVSEQLAQRRDAVLDVLRSLETIE
jgi:uncharacterized protein